MDRERSFTIFARLRSFRYAGRGLVTLLRSEHNARIHAVATVLVVTAGVLCQLERWEWGLVTAAIGLVWTAEALNASLEQLGDAISRSPHPAIGRAKDLAAGAVLASALGAAGLGLVVFGPRLDTLVGNAAGTGLYRAQLGAGAGSGRHAEATGTWARGCRLPDLHQHGRAYPR